MAHHSKFLSVNLNKSYGKSSSSSSSPSAAGYGNGRPHSAGGRGGMVVLSRPRSSSGTAVHKPAPRLAVPPPVNLPSLRKEHEGLNPASSKPLSGHGGSGLGPGHSSSMSWTKPTSPMPDFRDKDGGARTLSTGEQRSFSSCSRPQGFTERAVILRGEDFPSLLATSTFYSKQKQKVSENSDGLAEKAEPSSVLDMRPKLRSSPLTKSNVQGSEGGSSRVLGSSEQSRKADGNFPIPLPLVRLRHTCDWDDDERDRNHGISGIDHYAGRVLHDGEARSSFSRDSGRGEPYGKEFMASKKEDRNFNSWRVMVESNKEFSTSRVLHVDKDHFGPRNSYASRGTGKESSHDRLSYGDRKEFGSGLGIGNARVAEASNDRVEVSNNWKRGKPLTNGMISKRPMSPRIKGFSTNDPVQNLTKEKLISNAGRSYAEDASWGGKDTLSSDAMLDLKAKLLRKKKEAMKNTDLFDPARESFEAELERVQRLQEQERQQVMEEQAREMEVARREAEERERIAREEEERRRLLEEEVREAAWSAEQEKLEATRRAEEQRIAREEEKRKILMEEERRKEAARQKLLELEAKIARRQTETIANDRMKESDSLRDSDLVEWEKTERIAEQVTSSPSFDSSSMNRLFEAGFKPHTLSVDNYSFAEHGKSENNWSNNSNSIIKFQEQDSGYPTARQDAFASNRGFLRKHFQSFTTLPPPLRSTCCCSATFFTPPPRSQSTPSPAATAPSSPTPDIHGCDYPRFANSRYPRVEVHGLTGTPEYPRPKMATAPSPATSNSHGSIIHGSLPNSHGKISTAALTCPRFGRVRASRYPRPLMVRKQDIHGSCSPLQRKPKCPRFSDIHGLATLKWPRLLPVRAPQISTASLIARLCCCRDIHGSAAVETSTAPQITTAKKQITGCF